MEKYDPKLFRYCKHPIIDVDASCRHCDWSHSGAKAAAKARQHAKTSLHTVDVYKEVHTEYTSRNNKVK